MYDYIVIGAGIIGSMIARELSRYEVKALVVEKENDVANVQSLANSAILHSGHNPEPNSLKAKLSVMGNKMYDQLENELEIPLLRSGAYVVAHNQEEEVELVNLAMTAKKNNVEEFAILDFEEAKKTEPNLSRTVTKVLSLPTTKVTYPWEVAFAAMENALKNGIEFRKNSKVTKISKKNGNFLLEINNQEEIETKMVINASGVACDDVASLIEKMVPYKVNGRKGEYFVVDKRMKGFANHVLYPLPTELGKGVLVTPQVHGEILLGPNSENVENKYSPTTSYAGLAYVKEHALSLAENIPFASIIRSFAGVRATINYDDFYIKESLEVKGFYHVAGIDSPGLTAAPAIAKYLLSEILVIDNIFKLKDRFDPYRKKNKAFRDLDISTQKELIRKDSTYGNIICKCERITEREIIDAIHAPLGSSTIKGIKKRTRAGAGLCQGGYCEEKVVKLISRELGVSPLDVLYDSKDSSLFIEETKVNKS